MGPLEVITRSPEETQQVGAKLARSLKAGDVLALTGEMGAGKTTFVRGIGQGLEVPVSAIASPSFVLVKQYRGRLAVYHADLFRLDHLPQAATVGLEEFYDADGVTLVEWARKIPQVMPEEFLEIVFEHVDESTRKIRAAPHGPRYEGRSWL